MSNFDHELDVRGLNCPLPILHTKRTLKNLDGGQVLRVLATDPGSARDFEAFSNQTRNELLESVEQDGEFHYLIKKRD